MVVVVVSLLRWPAPIIGEEGSSHSFTLKESVTMSRRSTGVVLKDGTRAVSDVHRCGSQG